MTADELVQWDRQRERWSRARRALHLVDIDDAAFATGGIAALVRELSVRLLILPADPEAHRVEFDEDFVTWWMGEFTDPVTGRPMAWGTSYRPSATTAARGDESGTDDFYRYIAIRRDGGLDVGLSNEGGWRNDKFAEFRLVTIVGRVWSTCHLYLTVMERFCLEGPWEISLALRGTQEAALGGFGEGWLEPRNSFGRSVSICHEPNVLLRRELPHITPDVAQPTALSLGGQIEDAFGSRARRFNAHRGQFAGQFDRSRYGWG